MGKNQAGISKQILKLASPLIAQNLSYTIMGVIDTFFVSRISTDSVAAVGLAGILFFAILVLFRSTANSSVVFVGRAYGAKDYQAIGKSIWKVLNVVAILSLLVFFLPGLYKFLFNFAVPAANPNIRAIGHRYLQIIAYEVPFVMFSAVVWGFLVGRNDSRTPMLLAWFAVASNIFLDWLLVLGNLGLPRMGVEGAAYATLIANILSSILSAIILWRPKNRLDYGTGKFRIASFADIKQVIKIGLPMGFGDFVEISSFSIFFSMLGRLGTDVLAASNIALQYMSISFTMGMAIAQAGSSLVSQYLGAKEPDNAELVGYRASAIAGFFMALIGLSYLIAPKALIGVFTDDPKVIAAGVVVLKMIAFYQAFDGIAIVLSGALNGAGDTAFTMFTKIIFGWGVFLPLTWLLAFKFNGGVVGAWAAAIVYLSGLAIIYFLRFRNGAWKSIEIG